MTALLAAATRPRSGRPQKSRRQKRPSPAPRRPHATPQSGKRAKIKRARATSKGLARPRRPLPKPRKGKRR
jgi:hypothetical protein